MGIKVTHNDVAHLKLIVLIERVVPLLRDGYQKETVRRGLDAKRYVSDPMFISHFRLRIPLPIRGFIFLSLNLTHPVYMDGCLF